MKRFVYGLFSYLGLMSINLLSILTRYPFSWHLSYWNIFSRNSFSILIDANNSFSNSIIVLNVLRNYIYQLNNIKSKEINLKRFSTRIFLKAVLSHFIGYNNPWNFNYIFMKPRVHWRHNPSQYSCPVYLNSRENMKIFANANYLLFH